MNNRSKSIIVAGIFLFTPLALPVSNPLSSLVINKAVAQEDIKQLIQAITVKISNSKNQGSGVIIAKNNQNYTVLTNAHVVSNQEAYYIQTSEGKTHQAKIISRGSSLEGNDLAVLEFQATENYQVVPLAVQPNLRPDQLVYAAGFPNETEVLSITTGKITLITVKPFIGGYQIGYTNNIQSGMSGGPVLNQKGELIGVNGLLSNPILNETYTYQDGSQPTENEIRRYREVSFAVPIETLMQIAPTLAVIPSQWKEGVNIAEKVDNIAQQISVRIDSQNHGNGSGAIIGKEGQNYYVVTAAHVVKKTDNYVITTPDGQKYPIQAQAIYIPKGLDAALIQFTSTKTYTVGTIATYDIPYEGKQWVFISGFPGQNKGMRKFTSGVRYNRDKGIVMTKDFFSLNIQETGYELIYTNLSQAGMSGGPVLDSQGQIIGINAGVEGEYNEGEIILGRSIGVPSSNLLGLATKKGIKPDTLKVITSAPPDLSQTQINSLKTHSSFLLETPPNNGTAADWLNYGNQLWRLGRYEEAVKALQQALKLKPDLHQAYYALGLVRLAQYRDAEAVEAFEQCLKINPNYFEAWRAQSEALLNLEKYPEALAAIEQAIKIRDDDYSLYLKRGLILRNLQRYQEAKQAYNRSIELYPTPMAYAGRGLVNDSLKDNVAALQDYDKGIALQPKSVFLYQVRGWFRYTRLQDFQGAIADLTQAIELQPNEASNYDFRASAYSLLDNNQEALKDLSKAIELKPDDDEYYNSRSGIYFSLTNFPEALKDVERAIKLNPKKAKYYSRQSSIYLQMGNKSEALTSVNQVIALEPKFGAAYYQRALLLFDLDIQSSLSDLNKSIALQLEAPELWLNGESSFISASENYVRNNITLSDLQNQQFAAVYSWRGDIYLKLKEYPKALADYNQAIQLDPKNAQNYTQRAKYYLQKNELEKAKADYTKAIELDPNQPKYYHVRSLISFNSQNYQEALQDINKAIELDRNNPTYYYFAASIRWQLKDYQGALNDAEKALKQGYSVADVYAIKTTIYVEQKEYEKAINDLTATIQNYPQESMLYAFRGNVYVQIQKYQQAEKDYSEAIKINPEKENLWISRANIRFQQKNYQGSIVDYNQAIKLNPNSLNSYIGRGLVYHAQGNYNDALADYNLALSKDGNSWIAINNIGFIKYEQGDIDTAIQQWEKALKINEKSPETNLGLGVALYIKGDTQKGLEMAKKALQLDKTFGQIETLKRNLWGDRIISDTQKLLADPAIKVLLSNVNKRS